MATKTASRTTMIQAATSFAALCSGLAPVGAVAAPPAPTLISGKIDSQVIHIGAIPVAPKLTLDLHGETERVFLSYTGPNGQPFTDSFYSSEPNGKSTFDGVAVGGTFSPYAPPGTWTLSTVELCSAKACSGYTGSTLAPLFPSLTFTVVNSHYDNTPPTINSAVIETPTIPASNNAKIEVDTNLQDDRSGVVQAEIEFNNGSDYNLLVGNQLTYPIKSAAPYKLVDYCRCKGYPTGTYTAVRLIIRDAAGNTTLITDAGQISTLFNGQTTITVGD